LITGPKNWFPKFGRKIDNPSGFYKNRSIFMINRSVFPKTGSGPERTESTSAFFFFVEWLHQQLTKNKEHEALKSKHLLFRHDREEVDWDDGIIDFTARLVTSED
jgi:hypothetical protein